jgi:F-type H+-transporting ATPase subunit epsilon
MRLEIITAEREVYSEDVDVLVAPGIEGQLGILPHHAPLMTVLQPGEIMIRQDGEESYLAVTGGFMEVLGNKVTILADACERSDEINEERAQAAVERARERLSQRGSDLELTRAAASMRRAQVRLNVVQRRRRRGGPSGLGESGGGPAGG